MREKEQTVSAYQEELKVYKKKNILGNQSLVKCLLGLAAIGSAGGGMITFSLHIAKEKAYAMYVKGRIKEICQEKLTNGTNDDKNTCTVYLKGQKSLQRTN